MPVSDGSDNLFQVDVAAAASATEGSGSKQSESQAIAE